MVWYLLAISWIFALWVATARFLIVVVWLICGGFWGVALVVF